MGPDVGVASGVCTLWKEDQLVDYTIEVEDQQFRVHKVILASVSDYFKAMLTGSMIESQTQRIRLEGLQPLVVSNMIEYIYTGEFGTNNARTKDLLDCAVYFQFRSAIEKCCDLLFEEIDEENCFEILLIFKAYSMDFFVGITQNYIQANIGTILKKYKPNDLSYDAFLARIDFWGKSEWDLFDSANMWISVDFENRVKHLNDLMCHIRFALMDQTELEAVQDSYIFTAFKDSWCNLVSKAIEFHTLPTHLKVIDDSGQNCVRNNPSPVCFSAGPAGEYYVGDSWTEYTSVNSTVIGQPAAVLVVNNYLIVCGEYDASDPDQDWFIFDPHCSSWSAMACMTTPRDAFALAHYGEHLYALGGLVREASEGIKLSYSVDDGIERYDFENNTWNKVTSKMPIALQKHVACCIGDSIYVTGGWNSVRQQAHHSVQLRCYDPSANIWHSKPSMPDAVCDCKILTMNLWNEEVLLVIGTCLEMQYYSPCTNQWSEWHWKQCVDTEISLEDECTILAKGSTIYFLNFCRKDEDSSDAGEYYRHWFDPPDSETIDNACEKWLVEAKGKRIAKTNMDDFPLASDKFFCALLSFVPYTSPN